MSSNSRDEAQTIIRHLAEIGPRRAGSPQEATAAAFVNAQMRRAGMGVTTTPLMISPRRRRLYAAAAFCGLFAALTTIVLPLPALTLALAAAGILLVDALAGPLLPFGPAISSQSIIGTQAIAHDDTEGPRDARWRVVLLAPLDSPGALRGLDALAWPTRSATLLRIVAQLLVATVATAELLRPRQGWALLAIPAVALLGLQVAAALRGPRLAAQDGSVGALASILLAARQLRNLGQVEIWAVAIGASSLDVGGVEELLRSYPFNPVNTLIVAVEQLAGAQLAMSVSPGGVSHALAERASAAAAAFDIELGEAAVRSPLRLSGPLQRRGLPVLTLSAGGGAHQPSPQLCDETAQLIVGLVAQLEAESAEHLA